MDAIDILGSILGGKSGGGGMGGQILKEILGAGKGGSSSPRSQAPSSRSGSGSRASAPRHSGPIDIEREARELEDMFNVGRDPGESRAEPPPITSPSQHSGFPDASPGSRSPSGFQVDTEPPKPHRDERNQEALTLIRAMVNAAKSDGRITRDEQQNILARISGGDNSVADFLRSEFDKPLDVREFAWSVPLGLEQKVYMLSLAAIDLDTQPEASYLRDLAHGLRLSPDECNAIHQRLGAPPLNA